jgi:hypothetical protein
VNDRVGTRNQSTPAASRAVTTRSTLRRRTEAGLAVSSMCAVRAGTGFGTSGTQSQAARSRRSGATRGRTLRRIEVRMRRRIGQGVSRMIRRRGTPSSFRRMSVGGASSAPSRST